MDKQVRICYLGCYDREHVRNRTIIDGLRAMGVDVHEIHESVWTDTGQRVAAARRGLWQPRLWGRLAITHARLANRYLKSGPHDLVIVGYPGHLELPLARLLTWLRGKPLIFDALVSLYETTVEDRGLLAPQRRSARLLLRLERLLYRLPDRILVDTDAQGQFLQRQYGAPAKRLLRVWVGAPDDLPTMEPTSASSSGAYRVVYFGKFIPLHGLETILGAAHLLRDHADIRFELLGDGQTFPEMQALAERLGLDNVLFYPEWLSLDALARRVAGAGICLGIFGAGAKAQRVIPTKAYLALTLGLPLVTADTSGARELLVPDEHALLCRPGDSQSLAESILRLYHDPQLAARLARQGRALYQEQCTPAAIGAAVFAIAQDLLG